MTQQSKQPSYAMPPSVFREFEAELAYPLFYGVNLAPTLNDLLLIDFRDGQGDWRAKTAWLNRTRTLKHWLYPQRRQVPTVALPREHVLMTWLVSSPRFDEMLVPILAELSGGGCAVLHSHPNVRSRLPQGIASFEWDQVMTCKARAWRAEYERCRPEWTRRLKAACRRFGLPNGAFEVLSLNLLIASQRVAGSLDLLQRGRPAVILTEYDRNYLWSCLVLAARRLGIPTITLVHGVMEQDAIGYAPILADTVLCWGELDRAKLLAAGVPPEKVVIGGCPRLSRDLPATPAQGRMKLNLDPNKPVVMFGTSPERQGLQQVEPFCAAIESMDSVSGVVRLHPADEFSTYAPIAQRHPNVRFSMNSDATLDESLAAADVVVVRESGVGSDALVKRRPVVVLSSEERLTGHNWDLVERAGCPHARTAGELTETLQHLVFDEAFRKKRVDAAERYVADFCGAFGEESARRIADTVKQVAARSVKSTHAQI